MFIIWSTIEFYLKNLKINRMIRYIVAEDKIEKLAKRVSRYLNITIDDAKEIIYNESALIVSLFIAHTKVKDVYKHLIHQADLKKYIA